MRKDLKLNRIVRAYQERWSRWLSSLDTVSADCYVRFDENQTRIGWAFMHMLQEDFGNSSRNADGWFEDRK